MFSFTSITQNSNNNNNSKTSNLDDTSLVNKSYTSKSPRQRTPKISKTKPTIDIPTISIEEPVDDKKLYSPVRSESFESFTKIMMDHNTEDVPGSSDVHITPPKRNSLYRPSPRLLGIDGLAERRSPKSRSLYLEVLNRRSFTIPEPEVLNHRPYITPDPDILNRRSFIMPDGEQLDPRRSSHEVVKSLSLRSIAGYATLPRKYKRNKTREKQTSVNVQ